MIVIEGKKPTDCLHCQYRKVIFDGDRHYQMCGLNTDGYLTESYFKTEDLMDGFISEKCPIVGDFEEVFVKNVKITDSDYLMEIHNGE